MFWQWGLSYLSYASFSDLNQGSGKPRSKTCIELAKKSSPPATCVSFINTRIERFVVDESQISKVEREALELHRKTFAKMRAQEDQKLLSTWTEYFSLLEKMTINSNDYARAGEVVDINNCEVKVQPVPTPLSKKLCPALKIFFPVIQKYYLI